jgi:hypothetical protein
VLSAVGSMSQIIVTFVAGLASLLYLRLHILNDAHRVTGLSIFWLDGLIYAIAIGIILFILLYFRLSWAIKLLEKIPFIAKHKFFVQKLEDFHWKELTRILVLSFCRYVVFVVQYVLLLQVFEVNIGWLDAASMVCVMFLGIGYRANDRFGGTGFQGKDQPAVIRIVKFQHGRHRCNGGRYLDH